MNKRMKVGLNRLLRPFTLWLIENIGKKKYRIVFNHRTAIPQAPAIFAFTHISANDTMIVTQIIRRSAHVLIATDPMTALLRIPLMLLGMIPVDRTDRTKRSQRKAMSEMIRLLELGSHVALFPEAIWNVKANRLVLPLHWGVIELAQRSGCSIIPVAMLKTDSGDYHINMGESVRVGVRENKADAIEELYKVLYDLTGQMVFDPQIQEVTSRNGFSPESEYRKKIQSDFGFVWDAEYESQFLQCHTLHEIERKHISIYINDLDKISNFDRTCEKTG